MSFTTFVLVPGAGGHAWYWHLVTPVLERHGYEAIPVQLPAADNTAGLSDYAQAVVAAIGHRDPASVVLVAQSLGGFVGALVCERLPIGMLVFVNAMPPGRAAGRCSQTRCSRRQARRSLGPTRRPAS
jgi:pimeloyl-ACP methyl ester carboxylesterase